MNTPTSNPKKTTSKLLAALLIAMLAALFATAPDASAGEASAPDERFEDVTYIENDHGTFKVVTKVAVDAYAGRYDAYFTDDSCGGIAAWRFSHWACIDVGDLYIEVTQVGGEQVDNLEYIFAVSTDLRRVKYSGALGIQGPFLSASIDTTSNSCVATAVATSVLTSSGRICQIKTRGVNLNSDVDVDFNIALETERDDQTIVSPVISRTVTLDTGPSFYFN